MNGEFLKESQGALISYFTDRRRWLIALTWSAFVFSVSLILFVSVAILQDSAVGGVRFSTLPPMLIGSAFVPVLFFFTSGLEGYREGFEQVSLKLLGNKVRRSDAEMLEEFGNDALRHVEHVGAGNLVLCCTVLEAAIIGWDVYLGYSYGFTGLAFLAFLIDNLIIAYSIRTLENFRAIARGRASADKVYKRPDEETAKVHPVLAPFTAVYSFFHAGFGKVIDIVAKYLPENEVTAADDSTPEVEEPTQEATDDADTVVVEATEVEESGDEPIFLVDEDVIIEDDETSDEEVDASAETEAIVDEIEPIDPDTTDSSSEEE